MNPSPPPLHAQPSRRARWVLWSILLGLIVLVLWASVARVAQVTRVKGQVISTARTQVVQAVDGGKLTELLVREGDAVKAGQRLAVLEKERAQAAVDDSSNKIAALNITLARLQAEVYGTPLQFDPQWSPYAEYIRNQRNLYQKRRQAIEDDVQALQDMHALAKQELAMHLPLLDTGDVSRADILKLQRQVADIQSQITNKRNKYIQDAQAEMTKAQEELSAQQEQLRDRSQVLEHTELLAQVDGVVKNIKVNTIGGVVKSGETVLEILPNTERVVEVNISPADIGFVQVGQSAQIKFDAYDYTIFGSRQGRVTYISPDTILEEGTRSASDAPRAYYRVSIRLDEPPRTHPRQPSIQILSGMTVVAEIKAQDRTVLSYLTKPITKTWSQALSER